LPGGRELNDTSRPFKQENVEFALKLLDFPAEWRLGHVETGSSTAEM
jgi:hypothetical protein